MGMFDTVYITCPNCGNREGVQSKSGRCFMEEYTTIDTAPMDVMADVLGYNICYSCGESFIVELASKPTYTVRKTAENEKL